MNSEKKALPNHEVIKIEEKKKDPLPGEPGHYRYEKDQKTGKNKVTTIDSIKQKEADKAKALDDQPKEEPKVYSKTAAKDMKREEQEAILKSRNVKFSSNDKELALISKILNSNPKK